MQHEKMQRKIDNHQSLGFQIMVLLTSKLNGQYEITSNQVTGTTVQFMFNRLISES